MTQTRRSLLLSGAGMILILVGVILFAIVHGGWVGPLVLIVGLVVLGIGWFRFAMYQRRGLWNFQTEIRNLRERQDRWGTDLSAAVDQARGENRETVELAADAMREETKRHEAKLRELQRLLLELQH
ncbi:hypothetical protein ACIGDM_13100 [Rothia koreensis]|uniref:hypothetical protein n=1 Tax=Rothia koreensis TaxID=592378 RepID=UPI0037C70E5D